MKEIITATVLSLLLFGALWTLLPFGVALILAICYETLLVFVIMK